MRFSLNKSEEKKLLSLFNQHEINLDYLIYLRSIFIHQPVLLDKKQANENDYETKKKAFEKLNSNEQNSQNLLGYDQESENL